jgi:putative MATE family efflux protein
MTRPVGDPHNKFLTQPLPALYARTAAPIIFIMGMNGLLTVIDAFFLGRYVGADALTAVTLMFPAYMLLVALATLVAGGMASLLARLLGAAEHKKAREVFAGAHGLALIVCLVLIAGFLAAGRTLTALAAGSAALSSMGYDYISVLVFCSPVMFFLSLNSDALRCEGRMGLMALIALATSLANIGFNFVLIAILDWGVAGSAWGTVFAQGFALLAVLAYRIFAETPVHMRGLPVRGWVRRWPEFLALGAPQSLTFLGISLGSAAIIAAVYRWGGDHYAVTVAAYGIITRILTFIYLPLLGLNMAMQTITGNNFGASLWHRSDASLRLAAILSLAYNSLAQAVLFTARHRVGFAFVDDPATVAEVARILPLITMMLFAAGPIAVLSSYFQAIGEPGRAAILSLSRTYLYALPLTFLLPFVFGETGIWLAGPVAEILAVATALAVLLRAQAATGNRLGVFRHTP